jgi:hypothetical protein
MMMPLVVAVLVLHLVGAAWAVTDRDWLVLTWIVAATTWMLVAAMPCSLE